MQQNLTTAQHEFIRLNPTVGYEQDTALDEEIDLAIDFQLECEAPPARIPAEKRVEAGSWIADPAWIERFNAEAEASFNRSFSELLGDEDKRPAATPSLPLIPSRHELAALRAELARRKKGAA